MSKKTIYQSLVLVVLVLTMFGCYTKYLEDRARLAEVKEWINASNEGSEAFEQGHSILANPYLGSDPERSRHWLRGWNIKRDPSSSKESFSEFIND